MKKFLAILLVLALTISLLGACGTSAGSTAGATTAAGDAKTSGDAATAAPKEFVMGAAFDPGTSSMGMAMKNNFETVVGACGGKVIYQTNDFSPDGCISAVEKLITAGADGLFLVPPADSVLPKIMQMCEEAEVYWGISFRVINDEAIRKMVESSKYYVGNCHEDEEAAGYNVGKILGESGHKKIAIISTAKGDTTGDLREAGLARACTEFGMEIVAEARGITQASDITKSVESFMASYGDLDCVIQLATTATGAFAAMTKSIEDAGKADKIKVACIDFGEGLSEGLNSGICVAACGGHLVVDPTLTVAMVTNSILGTPLNPDGKISASVSFMYLQNGTDSDNYFKLVEGTTPIYSAEEVKTKLIKYFNPEVTADSFIQIASQYSIADVVARHQ